MEQSFHRTVKRWYDNLARGSEITADVYLRRLGAICEENHTTPHPLASMSVRKIEEFLMNYVTANEKYAGSLRWSSHESTITMWNFATRSRLRA